MLRSHSIYEALGGWFVEVHVVITRAEAIAQDACVLKRLRGKRRAEYKALCVKRGADDFDPTLTVGKFADRAQADTFLKWLLALPDNGNDQFDLCMRTRRALIPPEELAENQRRFAAWKKGDPFPELAASAQSILNMRLTRITKKFKAEFSALATTGSGVQ